MSLTYCIVPEDATCLEAFVSSKRRIFIKLHKLHFHLTNQGVCCRELFSRFFLSLVVVDGIEYTICTVIILLLDMSYLISEFMLHYELAWWLFFFRAEWSAQRKGYCDQLMVCGVWLGKMRCTFCGLVDVPVISGKCTIPWNPICQRLLLWTKNCVNSGRDERMSQRFMNWSTAINCFIYFIYPATIPTESQHFLPSNSNDFLVQLTFRHAHTTQHSVYYWNSCVLNHLYTLSMFKDIAFWAILYIVCLSFHFQTILVMLIIFRSLHTLIALTYWIGLWFNFRLAKRMKIGNMFNIQNYQAAR